MNNKNFKFSFFLAVIISNVQAQENTINATSKDVIGMCSAVMFVSSMVVLSTRYEDIRSSYRFREGFLKMYALEYRLQEYLGRKFSENVDKYRVKVEYEWKKDSKYLVSNVDRCGNIALGLPESKLEQQKLSELCKNLGVC